MREIENVGKGWQPIVKEAVEKIIAKGGTILQIKEKFGGLRLYCSGPDEMYDEIQKIAEKAQWDCENICEECGAPGRLKGDAWIKTLCEAHERVTYD